MSEAGGSGSEELKECPPPSLSVLWFVKENPDRKKKKAIMVAQNDYLFIKSKVIFVFALMKWNLQQGLLRI